MTLQGIDIIKDKEGETMVIGSDFKIVNPKISESFGKEIFRFLNGDRDDFQKFDFDRNRTIFHRGGNMLIIEYKDYILRDKDLQLNKEYFQTERTHFSKELDGGVQVGELCGALDYKGKFYLIIDGLNKLIDRTDNIVYRGIIVNHSEYFGTNGVGTKKVTGETANRVEKIL